MNQRQTKQKIVSFIQKHVAGKPAIIGLSGGIDSSVVAFLANEALPKGSIHAILSPSSSSTKEDSTYAKRVAAACDIQYEIIHIDTIVESFLTSSHFFEDKKIIGNLKARIRMSLLYGKANDIDGMILGTGNKTELMTGYFTKHGDGAIDILPIGGLYKKEVYELATYMGVPQEIIDRPPSAGLWDNQYDEEELGMTYVVLDNILESIEQHTALDAFENSTVDKVKRYISNSEHKRSLPPICEI